MRDLPSLVIVAAAGLLLVSSTALAQAEMPPTPPPISVRLELVPSSTLPGIPVTLRATIQNVGREEIALPREAFLLVTTESGESRVAKSPGMWHGNGAIDIEEWPETRIKPGGHLTLDIESDGTFDEPRWLQDPRFQSSGRLRLQLLVGEGLIGERPLRSREGRYVTSSPAELRILEPTGEDAVVRQAMLDFEKDDSVPPLERNVRRQMMRKELVTRYPSSAYTGWLIASGAGTTADEQDGLLRAWLEKHPDDPHRDARSWILARSQAFESYRGPEEKAMKHHREAKGILQKLVKSKSLMVRKQAAKLLEEIEEN